ncbi:MAG: hypothetical protein ACEROO_04155 [Candidatus Bathyarchaeota archaeon]
MRGLFCHHQDRQIQRARSLSNRNSVMGSMFIECKRRPELGFFEPSIRATECPVWKKEVILV